MSSIDSNEGYIKCLADLSAHLKGKNKAVTLKELNKDFILPKTLECQNNIDTALDGMYQEYLKDHPEQRKNN